MENDDAFTVAIMAVMGLALLISALRITARARGKDPVAEARLLIASQLSLAAGCAMICAFFFLTDQRARTTLAILTAVGMAVGFSFDLLRRRRLRSS
jgi:Na+-translocating ferredoxin:NAD+ oxidoreductase RnfD subunit